MSEGGHELGRTEEEEQDRRNIRQKHQSSTGRKPNSILRGMGGDSIKLQEAEAKVAPSEKGASIHFT